MSKRDSLGWQVKGWKLQFKKQDEPGYTARLFPSPRGAVLLEHGGHGQTRARELTLDGAEPRRSEVLGARLQAVEQTPHGLAVLSEASLRRFDPESFEAGPAVVVDRLASQLASSPEGHRLYVGSSRFVQVVDPSRGVSTRLEGFGPPSIALMVEPNAELWVYPEERKLRLVRFDEGRATVASASDAPLLGHVARFLRGDGGALIALGKERSLDPMPFPGGALDRALERVAITPQGLERLHTVPRSRVLDLLGCDGEGRLVGIEARGNTRVQLLDPVSLEEVGSSAFPKSGMYGLSGLVSPTAVLGLCRREKLDGAAWVGWGAATEPPQLRVADARVTER